MIQLLLLLQVLVPDRSLLLLLLAVARLLDIFRKLCYVLLHVSRFVLLLLLAYVVLLDLCQAISKVLDPLFKL
jgi:hypothetical protein